MKEALPRESDIQHVVGGLIGRNITVKRCAPLSPGTQYPVAVYGGTHIPVGAVCVCELPLAIYMGAALTLIPIDIANAGVKNKKILGDILDNFREVVNVSASMFNQDGAPHVALRSLLVPPDAVPIEVTKVLLKPAARADFEVMIPGYGAGKWSAMAAY